MQPLLFDINAIVLVLGGILALSALIVAQKPNARQLIDRLTPYQAVIGVALVVLGIIDGLWALPKLADMFKINLLLGAVWLTVVGASILLGALFGMGQIIKMIPGNSSAQQKALQLAQKVAPYQVLIGLLGLAGSLLYFLYRFKLLTMSA